MEGVYHSPYWGPLQMVNERLCKSRNLDQEKSKPLYALYALCMGHTCVIKAPPPPRWPDSSSSSVRCPSLMACFDARKKSEGIPLTRAPCRPHYTDIALAAPGGGNENGWKIAPDTTIIRVNGRIGTWRHVTYGQGIF